MSWRIVVIKERSKLDLKIGYLVVRKNADILRVHLQEISTIIIESTAVSLTAALLCELVKRKIKVVFCDEKRNPISELMPLYGCHDSSGKIRDQIEWNNETKMLVWTEIVSEKIRNQKRLLEKLNKDEAKLLDSYINQIEYNDATNREGHAAKVYFNALFGMEFTRTEDNFTNATLNYGYSILLSAFNREIVANGYLTQLGIFHDNQNNHFNLGSDLMEPFRVLVDNTVYYMKPQKFEHEEKMELVNLLNKEIIIDKKTNYVNNAIKTYCKSVFNAINEKNISEIKFYRDEL